MTDTKEAIKRLNALYKAVPLKEFNTNASNMLSLINTLQAENERLRAALEIISTASEENHSFSGMTVNVCPNCDEPVIAHYNCEQALKNMKRFTQVILWISVALFLLRWLFSP